MMKKNCKLSSFFLLCCFFFASCGKEKYDMVKVKGGSLSKDFLEMIVDIDSEETALSAENGFSISVSDFYISKFEITQKLYQEVMSSELDANPSPSYFHENPAENEVQELRPVERLSWYDCLFFCNKLSEREGLEPVYIIENIERYSKDKAIKRAVVSADYSKNGYRLPTCAEWMYAANGGLKTKFSGKYSGSEEISEVAWYVNNADGKTHQVGLKTPNELGLYDMTGNVAEWCWDYVWSDTFENIEYSDYTGPDAGRYRYVKGGCFIEESAGAEFPYEIYDGIGGIQGLRYYNTGFRIARNAK